MKNLWDKKLLLATELGALTTMLSMIYVL